MAASDSMLQYEEFILNHDEYFFTEKPNGKFKCWNSHSKEISTGICSKNRNSFENELAILVELMLRKFDATFHIAKFHGCFPSRNMLLFEPFKLDLSNYVITSNSLSLNDIRDIIEQMATALWALKIIGVIHGNICPDNIMVERKETAVRAKLMNFSLARLRSDDKQAPLEQEVYYIAPETESGLPLSEAADMWCLGQVMIFLLSWCEHYTSIKQILMQPEDNRTGDVELKECVDLLQAMVTPDPAKRITPFEVLSHPFICRRVYPWDKYYLGSGRDDFHFDVLDFEIMQKLGQGSFGVVTKCRNNHTGEVVAVKRPLDRRIAEIELNFFQELMAADAHQHNIVKYHGLLNFTVGKALVFEFLDQDLWYILKKIGKPMLLKDIRVIIQQLAKALLLLKKLGIVHTDIKLDNVMTVDHQRPFSHVKLIDFGLAMYTYQLELGTILQAHWFRAPEVYFGLQLSEAIDMWSVGCMMASMVTLKYLFNGDSEEAVVAEMVKYLGMPPDCVLDKGIYTTKYFTRTMFRNWTHKNLGTKLKEIHLPNGHKLESLDDLKTLKLEENNETEAVERDQCIELLKAMLEMDPNKRITPQEVLDHPFITNNHKPASCSDTGIYHTDQSIPPSLRSGVTRDQSAALEMDHNSCQDHYSPPKCMTAAPPENRLCTVERPESLQIDSDKVKKSVAGCTTKACTNGDSCNTTGNAHSDPHGFPLATTIPSGVIMVQPAPPERKLCTVVEERPDSLQIDSDKVKKSSVEVAGCTTKACTNGDSCNTTGNAHSDPHGFPLATTIPSGVIMVQPAPPERKLCTVDEERPDSLQIDSDKVKKSSVEVAGCTTKACTNGDSCNSTANAHSDPHGFPLATTIPKSSVEVPEGITKTSFNEDPIRDETDGIQKRKKHKKKKWFLRFFAWIKKILHPDMTRDHRVVPEMGHNNASSRDCYSPPATTPPEADVTTVQPASSEKMLSMVVEERPDSLQIDSNKMPKTSVEIPKGIIKTSLPEDPVADVTKEPQPKKKKKKKFWKFFFRKGKK